MSKLEVGQSVFLKHDLKQGIYGSQYWLSDMLKDCTVNIKQVYISGAFRIYEDDYIYSKDMIDWDFEEALEIERNHDKPIMPKFFDGWFKQRSSSSRGDLIMMLTHEYFEDYLDDKFRDYYRKNKEKCYRAILDGYTVE